MIAAVSAQRHVPRTDSVRRPEKRPYIYEVDPLRGVTAIIVVAVHVLLFVNFGWRSPSSIHIQNAVLATIRFTRNVFMFITAFTLVYVYYGKPFSLKRFWSRRSVGVLLPYCLWSVAYAWLNTPQPSVARFARVVGIDLLTGQASYQLYYIGVTLQFYLLLPLFLLVLRRVARWPWQTLTVSFLVQWFLLYADYHYLQTGVVKPAHWMATLLAYRQNCALLYPFYFVLGGMAAIHLSRAKSVLLRRGRWALIGFVAMLVVVLAHFALQVWGEQQPLSYVNAPVQPIILFYSVPAIIFMCWLACLWGAHLDHRTGTPPGYRFWKELSEASFGIYLLHAAVLTAVANWVLPIVPLAWPGALRVFSVWLLAATATVALSAMLAHLPVLSRLVGRMRVMPGGISLRRTRAVDWNRARSVAPSANAIERTL
ncbi:MAG: acyltransferase [Thermomicrobiales bacterium]